MRVTVIGSGSLFLAEARPQGPRLDPPETDRDHRVVDLPAYPDRMVGDLSVACQDRWGDGGLVLVYSEKVRDRVHPADFENHALSW